MMFLDVMVETKKREIEHLKRIVPLAELERDIRNLPPVRNFEGSLKRKNVSIIAEIKHRSPSKGRLCEDFDPIGIARTYEANGAAAISVITEHDFFEGEGFYLSAVKKEISLPVLRKDFIIDPYQVYETKFLGGDALLLIAGLLAEEQLKDLMNLAGSLGLSALVEVHTPEEAEMAARINARLIGINNRNLHTLKTDLKTSLAIAPLIPTDRIVVSESGIESRTDIERLMGAGIYTFLVGEALMRAADIGEKLRELSGK